MKEVTLHWSLDCGSQGPGKLGFAMKSVLAERKGRNANSCASWRGVLSSRECLLLDNVSDT